MRVSQSGLDKFDNCARSFQYHVEDPVYYGGSVRATGTGFHGALEFAYPHRAEHGDFPSLAEINDAAHEAFRHEVTESGASFIWDEEIPTEEDAFRRLSGTLEHYFTAEGPIPWPKDWELLGVEVAWEFAVADNVSSRGMIDLVLRDPNDWIVGVDHKWTKGKMWDRFKHHPRKKAQGPLYVWAMRQLWPDAPGYRFVYDVITSPGKRTGTPPKFERRVTDPTDAQIAAAIDRLKAAAFMYETYRRNGVELPASPAGTLCSERYCDYWHTCPFGAALDQEVHFS